MREKKSQEKDMRTYCYPLPVRNCSEIWINRIFVCVVFVLCSPSNKQMSTPCIAAEHASHCSTHNRTEILMRILFFVTVSAPFITIFTYQMIFLVVCFYLCFVISNGPVDMNAIKQKKIYYLFLVKRFCVFIFFFFIFVPKTFVNFWDRCNESLLHNLPSNHFRFK